MKRQAIVLIHGIGEQKPMGTVRSFVKAIVGEGTPEQPTYWSKPDRMSQSFELRRLRSRGRGAGADFYEYYWAYNLQGTKLRDVLGWFKGLLLRRAKDVPPSARSLWLLSRLLVVSVAAVAGAMALGWGSEWKELFRTLQKVGAVSLTASGLMLSPGDRKVVDPWIDCGWATLSVDGRLRCTASGWLRLDALAAALTHHRSR